ncbi:GH92 family glycosyl hydrolase [Gryllotalpicola kribbensis]|uniref:GH92 family glycosyl hydrolase n=1 Tax=Gryllotalpicola kribbensis TaxID=993084 RepID=A0ABP8AHB5_9MICO
MHVLRRDGGPETTYNARPGIGSVSPSAFRVHAPAGDGVVEFEVPADAAGRTVSSEDELRYDWFPAAGGTLETRWDATAFALDVEFDDGTRLSDTAARDQHGNVVTPDAQAAAKTLYVDQWNRRTVSLAGRRGAGIRRIIAQLRRSSAADLTGWLDAVRVAPAPAPAREPLEHVDTRRGTQSSDRFSRGNTAPLVAVPHGGVFGLPMTDAAAGNWPYSYHQHNRDDGRPALQAFATSHLPSPWIGDRGVFQLMPSPLEHPSVDRSERALGFDHGDETARPHLYEVALDGGVTARLTAGGFALGLRFTSAGPWLSVIVDHLGAAVACESTATEAGIAVDVELDDGPGRPRHFVHVELPPGGDAHLEFEGDRVRGHVAYAAEPGAPLDVLVGISTIDAAQARANLAAAGRFDRMLQAAAERWRAKLATLELDGATDDQQRSIFGDLYRLFLYPNAYAEPEPGSGELRYRSPVDGEVRRGRFSANNGFWDTYRTCWPALALLTPGTAGQLAQGFVQHADDSGWTSRWSAPGPVDSMTGTTSDTVFADLAASGVDGFDVAGAYRSALVNATVPAPRPEVGRKGLVPGVWRGYIDTETHEGLSWTLDNAINDWSASVLARLLAEHEADAARRARLEAEAEYLGRRSLGYRAVFNAEVGTFLGRTRSGEWRMPAGEYDPDVWGHDYTETNGWGTAYTAPHDGRGLAELHGGESALGASLDRFFARPERAEAASCGSYGFVIHEQTEARDVRMGMLGLSNQPAHHIPFFYLHAGRHDDAHRVVTQARDRLFVGSDFGQGFPGDEDNGEMSGWHLFASLGLYPLTPASDTFVLTPPLLPRVVVRPEGGGELVITATNAGAPHIARVRWNGTEWNDVSISRRMLREGGLLEFELSDAPTGWAAESRPVSASLLHGLATPPQDLLARVAGGPADDLGASPAALAPGDRIELPLAPSSVFPIPPKCEFGSPGTPSGSPNSHFGEVRAGGLYTVTLSQPALAGWVLEGVSRDGAVRELDRRESEPFERPGQLRPFRLAAGQASDLIAVRFVAETPLTLLQLELLD